MKIKLRTIPTRTLAAMLLATTCFAAPSMAVAQQPLAAPAQQPVRIERIVVRGNLRVEPSTVISYMPLQVGMTPTDELLDQSIEALLQSGLFANAVITPQGSQLVVEVLENPIINRVIFEGNKALNEDSLLDEIQARPRGIFTQTRVQQDVQRIIETYRRAGRISAVVTPKVIEQDQSRVDLIFEISEGPKSGILDVNFLGNRVFSDNELRDVIVTERTAWYRFFSANDNYDPNRIEVDIARLSEFYRNQGYFDFSVISSVAELRADRNAFAVTFTVDEGRRYHFGEVTVTTELNRLNADILKQIVPIRTGDLYRDEAIEGARDLLIFEAGRAGFAFVDVDPDFTPNPDGTVNVNFRVTEGPRVYVERIDIVGNTQTLDRVIRRELELVEGDAYNRALVDRSLNNIIRLGFFADQQIQDAPGSAPDRTVLVVGVEEQPTGELSASAGYSSIDQLVLDVRVAQRNFRGRGQDVVAQVRTGSFQQAINFSFTEPKFQGRDLSFGFDLYSFRYDFSTQANYETTQTGGSVRFGFPLSQNSSMSLRYALRNDSIDVPFASCNIVNQPALCSQLGDRITSLAGVSWAIDRRNRARRPTRGYSMVIQQDVAGLGGETRYVRTEMQSSFYYGLTNDFILTAQASAGYVDAFGGRPLRINDRFFKGGTSFRGFETAGLGPRDIAVNSALGGKLYAIGTVEMTVPTFLPEQFGINAALFTEFGTLTGLDRTDRINCTATNPPTCAPSISVRDTGSIRVSAGVSVGWRSPIGPIQLDFSKVLQKEDYDRTEGFRFSTARSF